MTFETDSKTPLSTAKPVSKIHFGWRRRSALAALPRLAFFQSIVADDRSAAGFLPLHNPARMTFRPRWAPDRLARVFTETVAARGLALGASDQGHVPE
jgi:hypothetical protein